MSKELYNSGEMSVDGRRGQIIICKTDKGISVEHSTLYNDEQDTIGYYKEFPELPTDWNKLINESGTTEADYFIESLRFCKPYRVVNV